MIKYSEKRALIIEDFTEYARAVEIMLVNMGVSDIKTVTTGESAIQLCREHHYDIILSDYNLGQKKDGQQVLEELIAFDLISHNCVFIMITAEKTTAMVMAALEFQPDSYLTKPFNQKLLKVRIDKAINKKQSLAPIKDAIKNKQWKEAFKLSDKVSSSEPRYNYLCQQLKFDILKESKQYLLAIKHVENINKKRITPWGLKSKGLIYYLMNDVIESEKVFLKMTKLFPMVLEGYDWLAKIQLQLKKPVEAQQSLQKAINISPKLLSRQKFLGELAEKNNDYETMNTAYKQAVKFGQHSAFSHADEYIKLAKSIGIKLKGNYKETRKNLIDEVKSIFKEIEFKFKSDLKVQFRGSVARADFSAIIHDQKSVDKYCDKSNQLFDRIEEHLSANESIEIATSLKELGLSQLAECVLEEAVEQYFDNPDFIQNASKLTNNKHLIKNAEKANQLNSEAVKAFKKKDYSTAIKFFYDAAEIAPNNVNICLNYSQALLKQYQVGNKISLNLSLCQEILSSITRLSITDPRYKRFSELSRLNQLMIQKCN